MRLLLLALFLSSAILLNAQSRPNIVLIMADDLDDHMTPQFFYEVLPVLTH